MEERRGSVKIPGIGPLLLLGTSPADSPPWLHDSPPTPAHPQNNGNELISRPPRSTKAPPPHAALYGSGHRPSLQRSATLPPRLVAHSTVPTSHFAFPDGYPSVLASASTNYTEGSVETLGGSNGHTVSKSSREQREKIIENQRDETERPRRDSLSIYPPSSPGRSLLSVKGENENSQEYVGSDFFGGSTQGDSAYTTVKVKVESEDSMEMDAEGEWEKERAASRRRHSLNYPFPAFLAPRALARYPPAFVDYPNEGR